ncbi:hypothetical protein TB2_014427 [Malus domestica]
MFKILRYNILIALYACYHTYDNTTSFMVQPISKAQSEIDDCDDVEDEDYDYGNYDDARDENFDSAKNEDGEEDEGDKDENGDEDKNSKDENIRK